MIAISNGLGMCAVELTELVKLAEPDRAGFIINLETPVLEKPSAPISLEPGSTKTFDDPGKLVIRIDVGVMAAEGVGSEASAGAWQPDRDWSEDAPYGAEAGGRVTRQDYQPFSGATPPNIARSEAHGLKTYRVRVEANKTYTARLHFAEGFECVYKAGMRVFDVAVQGQARLAGVDPFAYGGGLGRSSVAEIRGIAVGENGIIEFGFEGKVNSAALVGLEIFEGTAEDKAETLWLEQPTPREKIQTISTVRPRRTLFIGNSHTFFWAMPETIAAMINTTRGDMSIEPYCYLHGGWSLAQFFNPAQDGPDGERILKLIKTGFFDWVVVQDSLASYPPLGSEVTRNRWDLSMANIRRVIKSCQASGTRLMLYTFQAPDATAPGLEAEFQHFATKEARALVVPSGAARAAKYDPKWNGALPNNFIDRNLDGVHLSVHNAYLNKCLFWIAFTGESPVGKIPRTLVGFDVPIDDTLAQWIEEFTWKFASDYAKKHGFTWGILSK